MYTRWLFDAVDRNRRARAFDWAFCRKNISNCKVNILSKRTVIRLSNALAHTVCSCRKPTEKTKNTEKKMEKKKQRGKAHRNRNKCDRPHSQYNDNSRRHNKKKAHSAYTYFHPHFCLPQNVQSAPELWCYVCMTYFHIHAHSMANIRVYIHKRQDIKSVLNSNSWQFQWIGVANLTATQPWIERKRENRFTCLFVSECVCWAKQRAKIQL